MLGILGTIGVALAQAIPEGDFESPGDLTGWTLSGDTNRITEQDSTILGGRVLDIDRRNPVAQACSPAFVVTRWRVSALMKSIDASRRTDLWVQEAGTNTRLATVNVAPSTQGYDRFEVDATPACGLTVEACVLPDRDDEVTYDDFTLDGAPCAQFLDLDGDGACIVGQDLNGDGHCADVGEFDAAAFDCDDGDPAVSSLEPEVCDGADNDCDGLVDDGFDQDLDGFTTCAGDCDDQDGYAFPGAPEACNEVDDDCDTLVDEDFDLDLDGYTTCAGDCDDTDVNVFDGAPEQCNDLDDDCDGLVDDDVATTPWWPDRDGDGYGDRDADPVEDCLAPPDTVSNGEDCDDTDPDVNPAAPDLEEDGVDDDCDGRDGPPPGTTTTEPTDTAGGGGTDTTPTDPGPGGIDDGPAIAVQVQECGCGGSGGSWGLAALAALGLARRRRVHRGAA